MLLYFLSAYRQVVVCRLLLYFLGSGTCRKLKYVLGGVFLLSCRGSENLETLQLLSYRRITVRFWNLGVKRLFPEVLARLEWILKRLEKSLLRLMCEQQFITVHCSDKSLWNAPCTSSLSAIRRKWKLLWVRLILLLYPLIKWSPGHECSARPFPNDRSLNRRWLTLI